MRYNRVVVSDYGEADVLKFIEDDLNDPKRNEVQIKVLAAGVAPGDIFRRKHPLFHANLHPPFTLGYDVAGRVVKTGSSPSNFKTGQLVTGFSLATEDFQDSRLGGYAEYVNVPEHRLVTVPDNVDPTKAVTVVLNYITAYYSLYKFATPKQGERLLVHGAAGGVGTAVLELGKLINLEMFGTASTEKQEIISNFGATPIDYRKEDFVKRINVLTNNEGIDIVMDSVAGDYTDRSYNLLREGGRYVAYGWQKLMNDSQEVFDEHLKKTEELNNIPDGRRTYAYYGMDIDDKENDLYRQYLSHLVKLLADGKINPIIECISLNQAELAHRRLEKGDVRGKLVLVPD